MKNSAVVLFLLFSFQILHAQLPAIEVEGNGILLPRLTNDERDSIVSPKAGLMIFNTESLCIEFYKGAGWYNLCNGGQFVTQPLNKLFGGNRIELSSSVTTTPDGGFVIAGSSRSSQSGDISETNNGSSDYWVVKLNASGDILWNKLLGGTEHDASSSVTTTIDGGFVIVGNSWSSESGDVSGTNNGGSDIWVVKLNASGDILWDKLLGGSENDISSSVTATLDGGLVIAGNSESSMSGDISGTNNGGGDFWIVKLSDNGDIIWDKLLGGSQHDASSSIMATADGGFIIAGFSLSSASGDVSEASHGDSDAWIVKIDDKGVILWEKLLGGNKKDSMSSITASLDDGFVIAGTSESSASGDVTETNHGDRDYWVIRLTLNGAILWNKLLGGSDEDTFPTVTMSSNGGFALAGASQSSASGDVTEINHGIGDSWVVMLDANGTILWDKLLGGSGFEFLPFISETPDGGFVFAGATDSSISGDVTETNNGEFDLWVVKLNADGNIHK